MKREISVFRLKRKKELSECRKIDKLYLKIELTEANDDYCTRFDHCDEG